MKATKHRFVPAWRRKLLTLAVASCFAGELAYANPTGPAVTQGQASIASQGNVLTVTNTPGTVINWQGFSIASQEITRFLQQSAASAVLNRVVGVNPSTILGQLQSNGRVFLINPNGITIGQGATIDVAGFLASTLNLSDADFLAGRYRFSPTTGTGSVVNQGTINTSAGGMVYLVGQNVENHGIIKSPKGEILLAAGKSIELVDAGTPEIRVQITAPDNQALNLGQLLASGGRIGMYGGLVRQSGVANANTAVVGENGKIVFKAVKDVKLDAGSTTTASGPTAGSIKVEAETGKATIAGTVEANATAGRGGSIDVSGQQGVAVEATGRLSANGTTAGGAVTLSSSAGPVQVAGQVSASASAGRGGQVAIAAATQASIAAGASVVASGPQGGGSVGINANERVILDAGSAIQANGASGGVVTVGAEQGSVEINGSIEATGSEAQGGTIRVAALTDITLNDLSVLSTLGQRGGEVRIEAREGTLLASGTIDASGKDGPGGKILLLGPRVGLIRNSIVNVSGRTGGGVALVGGDFQGSNPDVPNSQRTYVGPEVLITADAIETGDGGKVVIWSDEVTRFYGTITARGGSQSGNGGFVEVSGKRDLVFRGTVDASAPHGKTGTLLLDPEVLIINGGASNSPPGGAGTDDDLADNQILFAENHPGTTTITEAGLEALDANIILEATREIRTGGTAFDDGKLTIASNRNLTLRTRNRTADGDDTGLGTSRIDLTNGGTNSPEIVLQGTGALSITSGYGDGSNNGDVAAPITLGKITTASGSVSIRSNDTLTVTGAITTGNTTGTNSAGITLEATGAVGAVTINAPVTTGNAVAANTAGADSVQSGAIVVTSANDAITGNASGTLTTGTATATGGTGNGGDTATSGSITLSASGAISLAATNALKTGNATITGPGIATDTAKVGNITVTTADKIYNGTGTSPVSILFGTAADGGGAGTKTPGKLKITTDGVGGGDAAGIFVTTSGSLLLDAINATTGGNVALTASGAISDFDAVADNAREILTSTGTVSLTAGTSIGTSAAPLDVDTAKLTLDAGTTFNVRVRSDDAGTAKDLTDLTIRATASGISTTSDIDAGNLTAANFTVTGDGTDITIAKFQSTSAINFSLTNSEAAKGIKVSPAATADLDTQGGTLSLNTTGGDITVTSAVVLTGNTTFDTDPAGGSSAAGKVNINAAVDGGKSLTIDATADGGAAGGDVTVTAAIGGTVPLASLKVDTAGGTDGAVSLQAVTTTGAIDVSAATGLVTLNGNLQTDGGLVDFTGSSKISVAAATLTIDTETGNDGNAGGVTFDTTANIDGSAAGKALVVNTTTTAATKTGGNVQLGIVGAATPLASLTVDTAGGAGGTDGAVSLQAVTTTGAIDVSAATGLVTLNGNLQTDGGLVDFTGSSKISVAAATLTIDTETGNDGNAGGVTFDTTANIDGSAAGKALVVNTTTTAATKTGGNVQLGIVGAATPLASLTVDTAGGAGGTDGAVSLQAVTTTGAIDVSAATGLVTLNGNLQTDGGLVDFTGSSKISVAAATLTIDTETGNDGNAGGVTFDTTANIDGSAAGKALVVNTTTTAATKTGGNVQLGIVGAATPLASLTVDTAGGAGGTDGAVSLQAVTTTGAIDVSAATGLVTLNGNLQTDGGLVDFTGSSKISVAAATLTIDTETGNDGNAGGVTFDTTANIDGSAAGKALVVNTTTTAATKTGGNVQLGIVGAATPLASLTVDTAGGAGGTDGAVSLQAVTTTGAIDVSAATGLVTLNGNLQTDGGLVDFTGSSKISVAAATLTIDTETGNDGNAGGVTFDTTANIDGSAAGKALVVNTTTTAATKTGGNVQLGIVGAATPLASLTVDTAGGAGGTDGAVSLQAVTTTGAIDVSAATGLVTLNGNLQTDGGLVDFTGSSKISVAAATLTIDTETGNDGNAGGVTFDTTANIDGSAAGKALVVNTTTTAATKTGGNVQLGIVGAATPLASLTVDTAGGAGGTDGAVSLQAVTTTGAIDVSAATGLVTLNGNLQTDGGLVDFTGSSKISVAAATLTIDTETGNDGNAGGVTFDTTANIDGSAAGKALVVNTTTTAATKTGGNVQLGIVGAATPLASLTVDTAGGAGGTDGAVSLQAVTTTGAIDVSAATGLVTLNGNLQTDGGLVDFTGSSKISVAAATLTIDTETGNDGNAGGVTFDTTANIDGSAAGKALVVNTTTTAATKTGGNVQLGIVGAATPLASLTVDTAGGAGGTDGAVSLQAVTTTGAIDVSAATGLVTLNGNLQTDGGLVDFTGSSKISVAAATLTIDTETGNDGNAGGVTFDTTANIDGSAAGKALVVNTTTTAATKTGGNVQLGIVGAATPLASLTVDTAGGAGGTDGAVSLQAVTTTGAIDVSAATGLVTLNGNLQTDGGLVDFTGSSKISVAAATLTIDTETGNDGNAGGVTFDTTANIDGSAAGKALVVNTTTTAATKTGGNVQLGIVGAATPLASLTVDTAGGAGGTDGAVSLQAVTTTGAIDVSAATGLVTLNGNLQTDGGLVDFTGSSKISVAAATLTIDTETGNDGNAGGVTFDTTANIDGSAAGKALVVNTTTTAATKTGGNVQLGIVGAATPLASLTVDTAGGAGGTDGAVSLQAVTTTGAIDVSAATGLVTLNGNLQTDGGLVDFTGSSKISVAAATLTIDTETGNDGNAGGVTFDTTANIDGSAAGKALVVNTTTTAATKTGGNVQLGIVGAATPLASLTVDTAGGAGGTDGAVSLQAVTTTGAIDVSAATGLVTLNGNLQTDGGLVDFTGSSKISVAAATLTIDTETGNDGNAGGVTFDTTANIDGSAAGKALVVNTTTTAATKTGGNVQLGIVGAATPLASLTVDTAGGAGGTDGAVSLQAVTTTGAIDVSAATGLVTLNGTSYQSTTAGAITFSGPVDLKAAAGAITVKTAGAAGDKINFTGTVDDTGSDNTLALDAGAGGIVTFTGAVGGTNPLGGLTVTQSGGTAFQSTVKAATVTITDTADTKTVDFADDLTVTTGMTVAAGGAYNVAVRGTTNSVAGDTNFLNTGTVTLGDGAADTTTFAGGLDTTAATGGSKIAGIVQTTNTQMDLGASTMTADATLRSGSGVINVASITDGASSFTLSLGSGAQTGAVTFTGDATVNKLTTFASAYGIAFKGTTTTIDTDTNFLNTGTVTLGDGTGDTTTFTGGLDTTTGPSSTKVAGKVVTTGTQMDLGITTVTADATLNPGGSTLNLGNATLADGVTLTLGTGAGTTINANAIDNTTTANSSSLTINTTGVATIAGAVGGTKALNTVTVTQSGGTAFQSTVKAATVTITDTAAAATVDFADNLTVTTGMSSGAGTGAYNVAIRGASNTIAGATVFANTGGVTLGDSGDTLNFTGGVQHTVGTNAINGNVNTTNAALNLNTTTTVGGNSTLDAGSNTITLGNATLADGVTLTLGTGAGTTINANAIDNTTTANSSSLTINTTGVATIAGAVGGTKALNTVTVTQSGGTAFQSTVSAATATLTDTTGTIAFQDNTTLGTLNTANKGYNVSMTGGSNTVTNAVNFLNTGTVTLGNGGDAFTFTGGVATAGNASNPSSTTVNGNVSTTNTALKLGTTSVAGSSTLDAGSNTITLGNATLADGATLTLGTGAGTTINANAIDNTTTANSSSLTINTTGVATIAGAVGGTKALNTVTVTQSGGTAFQSTVKAATVTITDTAAAATVDFADNLTVTTGMSSGAGTGAYNVAIRGASNTIAGATVFANTGGVTLGDSGDTLNFTGGVQHTVGTNAINGNVNTTNAALNLNTTTTVGGNSTLDAGSNTITLGNATLADGVTLTLGTGAGTTINANAIDNTTTANSSSLTINTTGVATIAGAVGGTKALNTVTVTQSGGTAFQSTVSAATATLTDTTGTIAFQDNTTLGTLNTANKGYNVSMTGGSNTVTNAVNFLNTGTVTLGNGGDAFTFTGGVATAGNASNPSSTTVNGNVSTTNTALKLGTTSVAGSSTLDAGSNTITLGNATLADGATLTLGTGAGTTINANAIDNTTTANSSSLTINTTGVATIAGAVGGTKALNTVTVTQSGGTAFQSTVKAATVTITDTADTKTVDFADDLTVTTGMTVAAGGAYNVAVRGTTNSVAGDTNFLNTGTVTLGDGAADTTTFAGGLDTTAATGGGKIAGIVQTTNTQMDLGASTMTADATLRSGSGVINVASITDGASSFTLSLGSGAQTGAVTFTGDATVNKLTTFASAYGIAFKGATTAIDGTSSFINTGALQLGDQTGDAIFLAGGLTRTAGVTDLGGAVTVTGSVSLDATTLVAGQTATINAGANPVTFNTTVDGPGGLIVNTSGDTTFTGVVGGTTPLGSLQTNAGGTTKVNGGSITTNGAVGGLTFGDPVTINQTTTFSTTGAGSTGADINFNQTLTGPGGATDLTLNAGTTGNVTALGVVSGILNLVVDGDNVNMGGGIVHTVNNLVRFNSTGDVNYAQNGILLIGLSNVTGAATITANNGPIFTGGAGSGFTAGSLVLTATDTSGTDVGTLRVGAGGITTTGPLVLKSADGMTINGPLNSGNGNITLVAGNAPGMASLGIAPATNAGGAALGTVLINAPVQAGTGNITIYSTGPVSQTLSPTDAGVQTSNALTVRTYNNSAGAATITMENDKLTGGVTCATGNAGTGNCATQITLETRQANDTGVASNTSFPGGFAASEIRYKSISGTQIIGIGTASDVLLEADSWTLNAGAINGGNVNIVATGASGGGNINVGIAIPTSFINNNLTGGSLNLRAARDITILPGGSIGTQGTRFDHNLVLAAGDDIIIQGSIYLNGNMNLRANALAGDLAGHAPFTNTGSVIISTPGATSVEVRGKDITIGDAARPVQAITMTAGNAGTGQSADAILRADGTLSINTSGNLSATGGTATASAPSATATTADAILRGDVVDVLVGGNFNLTGGTSNITSGAATTQEAHAQAKMEGSFVALRVNGNASLTGGNANAAAGGNTSTASATISSGFTFDPIIIGDLTLTGGTSVAQPVTGQTAVADATAEIHTTGNLNLYVGRDLIIKGGAATATTQAGGSAATAISGASLNADGIKNIQVIRDFNVTGGAAGTLGASATATAIAGTDAGKSPSTSETLRITTGGNMTLLGGMESGANTLASAAILSAGEIKMFINGPQGLFLGGGGGTDMFQLVGTTLISLEGKSYPITVQGGIGSDTGLGQGDAFIISGAPPLNLDALLAAFLRTTDCVTFSGGSCTVPGSGTRSGDTTKSQGGAGVCK